MAVENVEKEEVDQESDDAATMGVHNTDSRRTAQMSTKSRDLIFRGVST